MQALVSTINADNILPSAVFGGLTLYVVADYILFPNLLAPLAYALSGVTKPKDEREKKLLEQKFPFFVTKGLLSIYMFYLWILYIQRFSGWEDFQNWHVYCYHPLPTTHPEYEAILPIYFMYYVYIFWIFFKDLLKERKSEGAAQYMFDFHHLLAIGLTHWSMVDGYWRGGLITRIIHEPTDMILYCSKSIETIYKKRTGKDADFALFCSMTFMAITWFITRIVMYGAFVYQMSIMMYNMHIAGDLIVVCFSLWFATFLMYVLQVVWTVAVYGMWNKHRIAWWTGKGNTDDDIHPDSVGKKKVS